MTSRAAKRKAAAMTNIHVLELPIEIKLQRVKAVPVSWLAVSAFLQQDGSTLVRCEGWPEACEIIGVSPIEGGVMLMLYNKDFPIVLNNTPEIINVTVKAIAVPEEMGAEIWDAWVEPEEITPLSEGATDAPAGS